MHLQPIPRPDNEAKRVSTLHRYGILDTPSDAEFDFLTELAAYICEAPFSFVVLVDQDRVWVKSATGMSADFNRPRDDDYCSWSILQQDGLHISDVNSDWRTVTLSPTIESGYRMYSGVNLHVGDGLHIGTLCVLDTRPRDLSPIQLRLLRRLGRQVMALIELRASQRELRARGAALEQLARRDELTGLGNRRELTETLERELAHHTRYGGDLSVALIDVDHFKVVNDRFGHLAGDEVLRRIGHELAQERRRVDVVGRYGGEEFLIVLPQTSLQGAHVALEALRERIARLDVSDIAHPVTVSCGIAAAGDGLRTLQALVGAADRALYAAKAGGRNRVVLAGAEAPDAAAA